MKLNLDLKDCNCHLTSALSLTVFELMLDKVCAERAGVEPFDNGQHNAYCHTVYNVNKIFHQ